METALAKYLTQIGDWFYYFRRVPAHLKPYDGRRFVRTALKTKDRREAERSAAIHDDFMEKYWADLIRTGSNDTDLKRYKQAQQMARAHGFAYRNIAEVAGQPISEIVARIETLGDTSTQYQREALLGGAGVPQTPLSNCLEKYWPSIEDRLIEKSDHQLRKYKVPRQTAFESFIAVVGDKPIALVDRSDVLKFRSWLMQRIAEKEIAGNTANKQLTAIKDILAVVGRDLQIETEFGLIFAETKFINKNRSRPPFEAQYVQDTFVNGKALSNLNNEAQLLLTMMIETGARPSELIGLMPEEFFLDEAVPHIWIKENKIRTLKTKTSERKIPLVGIALAAAAQIASTGLTRYQAKPDHASGTINKFLRGNDLLPSADHALYSLRHTFKDRLRDAGAPEEVMDELMGHRGKGIPYGRGHTLETKHNWLRRIAFELTMEN